MKELPGFLTNAYEMQQLDLNLSKFIHSFIQDSNIVCLSQKRLLLSVTAYAMFPL